MNPFWYFLFLESNENESLSDTYLKIWFQKKMFKNTNLRDVEENIIETFK